MVKDQQHGYRPGPVVIMQTIFLTLKLMGKIGWSWWWVLTPIWVSIFFYIWMFFTLMKLYQIFEPRNKE